MHLQPPKEAIQETIRGHNDVGPGMGVIGCRLGWNKWVSFQDGNGRLSRILTTLLLMRAGYAYVQYSSLESIVEQNKNGYYGALRQTQGTLRAGTPDWHPWIIFFLHALQQQKQRLEKKLQREHLLLSAVPELSGRILEYVREHGRGTIGEMAKLTGVSRNTIKLHLRQLVGQRQLALHGAGRGAWYSL